MGEGLVVCESVVREVEFVEGEVEFVEGEVGFVVV